MSNHIKQNEPFSTSICPYLGIKDDLETSYAFPSEWNNCHHCKPVISVKLEHQRDYCLSEKYNLCPVYVEKSSQPLPRNLRNQEKIQSSSWRFIWIVVLVIFLLILLTTNIGYIPDLDGSIRRLFTTVQGTWPKEIPGVLTFPSTPITSTLKPTPYATPNKYLFSVTAPFTTPMPVVPTSLKIELEATPTITRIPRNLETLIGIHHIFIIHRVTQGESLSLLAFNNGTTEAAITSVNYQLSTPLWVHQIVIIPVNRTDVSDLPPFTAYRVGEDIKLITLADLLNVDPELLQYYNDLESSDQLHKGEWLVIPWENGQAP